MGTAANLGRPLRVVKVYWFNPTAIGNAFTITDGTGKVLIEGRCEVANQSQVFDFPKPIRWKNFQVTVLGSGTLLIYAR